ncbi:hypothetical protein HC928_11205, partial [bacterium]|nr:hypothetical protein [bacterium]
ITSRQKLTDPPSAANEVAGNMASAANTGARIAILKSINSLPCLYALSPCGGGLGEGRPGRAQASSSASGPCWSRSLRWGSSLRDGRRRGCSANRCRRRPHGRSFVRMVEALPTYEVTGAPFEAWLYRIAAFRVADFIGAPPNASMRF